MNYLKELCGFERRMRRQPLPMAAQLLWHKLMDFDNRLFWQEWFSIDNDRLAELLGAAKSTTLIARDQLAEAGYIEFQRGTKKRPSKYRMISITALEAPASILDRSEPQGIEEYSEEVDDPARYFGWTEDLAKELQKTTAEIIERYWPQHPPDKNDETRVFHLIKHTYEDEDGQTVMTFPQEKKALLVYAFEQASIAGKNSWNYIFGIYRRFNERGIKTIDDAYDFDMKRAERRMT